MGPFKEACQEVAGTDLAVFTGNSIERLHPLLRFCRIGVEQLTYEVIADGLAKIACHEGQVSDDGISRSLHSVWCRPHAREPYLSKILQAKGLVKRFDDLVAVNDVSFSIEAGETYGLLGPNGAGKTTSISMVSGLLEGDAGEVTVAGEAVSTRSTAGKSEIGLVPQDLAIYPDLTAAENLSFFGRLYGMGGSDLSSRVEEVLDVIGLTDRATDQTNEFSGGMKRRLNIGIGLLHKPQLLILDEPTVGVDPQSRNSILESVEQLSAEGMAVLYTTHYMEEAERLCDRVAIIDEGEIRAEGTRRELVAMVGEKDRVEIKGAGDLAAAADSVSSMETVSSVSTADHELAVLANDASSILPEILSRVAEAGGSISAVEVVEPNLEAVFLHLTGKALRD